MALAEVCGINSIINFNKNRETDGINDYDNFSNFINNAELAVPPYPNVSTIKNKCLRKCTIMHLLVKIRFQKSTTKLTLFSMDVNIFDCFFL